MALHRDKGSPPEVSTSGGLRPNRCEAAAPVDGRSIIVQMGEGLCPVPHRWPQLTTRAIPRPGSLIITQLRDRHEVAARKLPLDYSLLYQIAYSIREATSS